MLRRLFSAPWFWGLGIFINLVLAISNFISFDQTALMFNLLCVVLCSVGYTSSQYKE